jgi:hypothetical protein
MPCYISSKLQVFQVLKWLQCFSYFNPSKTGQPLVIWIAKSHPEHLSVALEVSELISFKVASN